MEAPYVKRVMCATKLSVINLLRYLGEIRHDRLNYIKDLQTSWVCKGDCAAKVKTRV